MTNTTPQKILKRWQKILKLQDWKIKIKGYSGKNAGKFSQDPDIKFAKIKINPKKTNNPEHTIIHELIHIKLSAMDELIEKYLREIFPKGDKEKGFNIAYDEFMKILETTTEDLTQTLLKMGGKNKKISNYRTK